MDRSYPELFVEETLSRAPYVVEISEDLWDRYWTAQKEWDAVQRTIRDIAGDRLL